MNVTTVGKVLVIVGLVFSLLFLGWSIVVYSVPMNLEDPTFVIAGEQPASSSFGGHRMPAEELKWNDISGRWVGTGQNGLIYRAERRWQTARNGLMAAEKQRADNRLFYPQELAYLRAGNRPGEQPVLVLPEYRNYANARTGRQAFLIRGQPARNLDYYGPHYGQLLQEIESEHGQVVKLIGNVATLTGQVEVLRKEIAHEELTLRNSREEKDWLQPQVYSRRDEAEQLLQRQEELKSRIALLKGKGTQVGSR